MVPRNQQTSVTFVVVRIFWIARNLSGCGYTPVSSTAWPRKDTLVWEKVHFSSLNMRPASWIFAKNSESLWLCSFCIFPDMRTSSIGQSPPSLSPSKSDILIWKCLDADVMPNDRRWKQNLPHGVIKVRIGIDSGDRSICQKPEFESSFENLLAWGQQTQYLTHRGYRVSFTTNTVLETCFIHRNAYYFIRL